MRVAVLIVRLHQAQLSATPSARPMLLTLQRRMRTAVQGLKDTLGFNMAALRHLARSAKERAGVTDADAVGPARAVLMAPEKKPRRDGRPAKKRKQ